MATITAPSDFKGMVMLPQINAPVNIGVSVEHPVSVALQQLIDEKEPEVLIELLGYQLYKDFIAGLAETGPAQKWLDLKNGAEYTDERGKLHKYNGIKNIITRYVYYWYLRQQATNTNGVGEAINDTENSTRTSPAQKQTTAWNDMVSYVKSCYCFIHSNIAEYPDAPEFVINHGFGRNLFSRYFFEGYYYYWRRCNLLTPINVPSI